MNALDNLNALLEDALRKVTSGRARTIADALSLRMTDIVNGYADLIVQPESSPTVKLKALDALLSLQARVLKLESKATERSIKLAKHNVRQKEAALERDRVRAQEKALRLKLAAEKKRERRKIERVMKEINKGGLIGTDQRSS